MHKGKMHTPHLLTLILILLSTVTSSPYGDQCSSIVPQPLGDGKRLPSGSFLLQSGHARAESKSPGQLPEEGDVEFIPSHISETSTHGVLHVKARLYFQDDVSRRSWGLIRLDGYWSQTDGKLCMVGQGTITPAASSVLTLDLSNNATVIASLAKGTLRLTNPASDDRFDEISILVYNQNAYNYTLTSQANTSCSSIEQGETSPGLSLNQSLCSAVGSIRSSFELEYGTMCGSGSCNPLGRDSDYLPRFMSLNVMGCSPDGRVHMYIAFSNATIYPSYPPFVPNATLVAEGFWDRGKNRLCLMAGRVLNSTVSLAGSYVDGCDVGMSLRFPATLSVRRRSVVVGEIWSTKSKDDAGYFYPSSFRSVDNYVNIPGLKYRYADTNMQCSSMRDGKNSKRIMYPSPGSHYNDMGFNVNFRSADGRWGSGYFLPLFLGNMHRTDFFRLGARKPDLGQRVWNVSYEIGFNVAPGDKWREMLSYGPRSHHKTRRISAEGVYDSDTGSLCMMGCRYLPQNFKNLSENAERYDCNISVHAQFPPLSNGSKLTGSIESTRKPADPLYFDPLRFSSRVLYAQQSREEIKRMDLEIVMVIASLTLACVSIGSQLHHARRHPGALPSASLLTLGILAAGLMLRLVLNFEALFSPRHGGHGVLFGSGGWREANEVIVRFVTMVAFMLQFWLLQQTLSAKLADKGLLGSEGRVLKYCVSLYAAGILIAWLTHAAAGAYAGLVLDGFLLPQVLFNLFADARGEALAVWFYAGMTLVRALPHVYDAYRARECCLPWLRDSRLYANGESDFYSPVWDIAIPCVGAVLAVVVFAQQRFGGGCVVPARFGRLAGYERVSAAEVGVQMN